MDAEETREQEDLSTPKSYASPIMNLGTSVLLLTNPESDLGKMEMALRGLIQKEDGRLVQVGQPLMNDEGINCILALTQSLCNRVTIMSNFDEKMINPYILEFVRTALLTLMLNWQKYGMDATYRNANRTLIINLARNYVYVSILRAKNQGERIFLSKSTQEIISKQVEPKKPGMLAKVFGWN